jgi:hypothetical protein
MNGLPATLFHLCLTVGRMLLSGNVIVLYSYIFFVKITTFMKNTPLMGYDSMYHCCIFVA